MATMRQWEKEIREMDEEQLAKVDQALKTLLGWEFFKNEYDQLHTLHTMTNFHLSQRTVSDLGT